MKDMAIILFLLSATICIRTTAFGAPPPRHGIGHGRNPVTAQEATEAKEANEKSKKQIAPYLTDEGTSGRLTWKEYTVNPKAKGEATLLVVFGGRDSVKDDDYIPAVRVKAFAEAVNAKTPGIMKLETLNKTGHAESETAAYSKTDAWKWLF